MSYAATEKSTYKGSPVELYQFHSAAGTWCLTSADMEINYAGDTYYPVTMRRTSIKQSQELDSDGTTITIEAMNDIVHSYSLTNAIKPLQLTIHRTHRRDNEIKPFFKGTVVAISYENDTAILKVLLNNAMLVRRSPRVMYQVPCNHVIYSAKCGKNKDDYKINGVITAHNGFTITAAAFGTKPDGWFTLGFVEFNTPQLGTQMVMITDHVGSTLTLLQPLRNMYLGSQVSAYAGCNRSSGHCVDKFGNINKYLGWEYLPIRNPFDSGAAD